MTDAVILLPFNGELLALTPAEYQVARARAQELGFAPDLAGGLGSARSSGTAQQPYARLLNSAEMAEVLGVNSTTVEQMAKDGRVPCLRVGKSLRFDASEVLAVLRARHADNRPATHSQPSELNTRNLRHNRNAATARSRPSSPDA